MIFWLLALFIASISGAPVNIFQNTLGTIGAGLDGVANVGVTAVQGTATAIGNIGQSFGQATRNVVYGIQGAFNPYAYRNPYQYPGMYGPPMYGPPSYPPMYPPQIAQPYYAPPYGYY